MKYPPPASRRATAAASANAVLRQRLDARPPVSGDSMAGGLPERTAASARGSRPIRPGDRVLIRRQPQVEEGEIAAVWWNDHDEACLKRVFRRGKEIVLVSDNPNYPPAFVTSKEVSIIGKVVEVKWRV